MLECDFFNKKHNTKASTVRTRPFYLSSVHSVKFAHHTHNLQLLMSLIAVIGMDNSRKANNKHQRRHCIYFTIKRLDNRMHSSRTHCNASDLYTTISMAQHHHMVGIHQFKKETRLWFGQQYDTLWFPSRISSNPSPTNWGSWLSSFPGHLSRLEPSAPRSVHNNYHLRTRTHNFTLPLYSAISG